MHKNAIYIGLFLFFSSLFSACSNRQEAYLLDGLQENRSEQKELLTLMRSSKNYTTETRFTLINQIASNLMSEGQNTNLILFLTKSVEENPDDPYNAYWLLLVAHIYITEKAPSIAGYYFSRILRNSQDMEINGESIHLICLQNLLKIATSPDQLVQYYTELIARFSDEINLGHAYFMLARSYERLGEWERAIQTYAQFLEYGKYDVLIHGVPDAYEYAKRLVDYNSSSKDWTFETLDDLVITIKKAIQTYNHRDLDKYRAKVNFFAMSWKQDSSDNNAQANFQMRDFMAGNRIRYNDTLDASSNPNEAYLRTAGWSQYVSVWYLYFRKVNFPADPDIHGRWEWAGIYYGEKL